MSQEQGVADKHFQASAVIAFDEVDGSDFGHFIHQLRQTDARYSMNLSAQGDYGGFRCFLAADRTSGYAISNKSNEHGEYELINVFSTINGTGVIALSHALSLGVPLHLNCFSGLKRFYEESGFVITDIRDNWEPNGPDVLYMSSNPARKRECL